MAAVQMRPLAIAPSTNGTSQSPDVASAIAPGAGATTINSSTAPTPCMPFTCHTCARRKVKCDKQGPPCSTCRKGRLECYYEAPPPRKRKRKPTDDLHEKLEQYEGILKEHALLPPTQKSTPGSETAKSPVQSAPPPRPARLGIDNAPNTRNGQFVSRKGKSRYIDSILWCSLQDEELPLLEDDEDGENGDPVLTVSRINRLLDPVSAAILHTAQPDQNLVELHPTYDQAMSMWKIYLSHVEPLIKIMHKPTATAMVQRVAASPGSASKSTEALLFAIYHFAVTAMSDDECAETLDQPRAQLLTRYYAAVTQALVNATFLRTADITVLQAYLLFLLAIRPRYDPHTFWILTGIALRIALRIGLHRDPEALGLDPFDVQMRRRLWWQLIPLDGMSGQISGTGVTIGVDSFDTKQPMNINDEDIWPEMTEPPVERTGATDLMFCLMRSEVGMIHARAQPYLRAFGYPGSGAAGASEASAALEQMIDDLETRLEERFLRYCDPFDSFSLLAMSMGRGGISLLRLRLRLPRVKAQPNISDTERKDIWKLAMRISDFVVSVLHNPLLKRYSWHLQAILQYDAMIWILNEVRRGSFVVTDPKEVWTKIERIYECYPAFMAQRRAIHIAFSRLTLKAWEQQPAQWRALYDKEPRFFEQLRASIKKRRHHKKEGDGQVDEKLGQLLAESQDPRWTGPKEEMEDVPTGESVGSGGSSSSGFAMTGLEEANTDNIDWAFWDQLLRDTDAFPVPQGL